MVSALSRKELSQTITQPIKLNYGHARETNSMAVNKDNFPYALREFINSHTGLPTFDEIMGKADQSIDMIKMVK